MTVPREALGEVGSSVALYDVAIAATGMEVVDDDKPAAGILGAPEGSQTTKQGIHLFTDWRCSCVRIRGEAAAVQSAVRGAYSPVISSRTGLDRIGPA